VENVYGVVMNSKPAITGIHGGLECGVIAGLKRGMEIVSIGPTIKNPHSPSEYIEIDGVDLLYNTLLMISTKMRTL
jgi:dipeptidase D